MINDSINSNNTNNLGNNAGIISRENTGTINYTNNFINTNSTEILNLQRHFPSHLPEIIKIFADNCPDEDEININDFKDYNVPDKLNYNKIGKYNCIIEEYSIYAPTFDNILNAYDNYNLRSKRKVLRCIHNWYLNEKGKALSNYSNTNKTNIEKIQLEADNILETIRKKIIDNINNTNYNIIYEDIDFAVDCFICYCFIECKIFEKPPGELS